MTRVLTDAEFAAVRAKMKAQAPRPSLQISKARLTVNREPQAFVGANRIIVPKADPMDEAQHTIKADPTRTMAMDLSMAKTGLAWGKMGSVPDGTLCLGGGPKLAKEPEGVRLYSMARAIAWEAVSKKCGMAVFSEFYSSKFMMSLRASASLRGAVMSELARCGIPCYAVAENSARKAAGVDVTKRREGESKTYMKDRAHDPGSLEFSEDA